MEFKAILVFVQLDLLVETVKLLSTNANLHPVFMELAQIYSMTTNVHAIQDIPEEIVQCWQQLTLVIHIPASMELFALRIPMDQTLVCALQVTPVHSVKLTSMNV